MSQNILEIIPRGGEHFDVYINRERSYCIRGGEQDSADFLTMRFENNKKTLHGNLVTRFRTVTAALSWIMDQEYGDNG